MQEIRDPAPYPLRQAGASGQYPHPIIPSNHETNMNSSNQMKKKVYLVQCSYRKMDRSVVKGSSMIINCTLNVPMLLPTIPGDW